MSNEIEIITTALEDALVDQLEKELSLRVWHPSVDIRIGWRR
ncbi:MAG TPA: hypothetical protein VN867_15335 [Candidatus Binataceae bacterium]|nr:hypothetical protein [Candidatus Binataceae bacterium]